MSQDSCGKHQQELAVNVFIKVLGGKTSGLPHDLNAQEPPQGERWRETFPHIIRRGKATTVRMPADGIAYNHYCIKYVLKRLGDQRSSEGSTCMEGERKRQCRQVALTQEWEEKLCLCVCLYVCVCEGNEKQTQWETQTTTASNHYTYRYYWRFPRWNTAVNMMAYLSEPHFHIVSPNKSIQVRQGSAKQTRLASAFV